MELIKQLAAEGIIPENNDFGFPSHWVKVNGIKTHYKSMGEGPPVIFLHGGANDWHEWKDNILSFANNFHVYALDLPGFGLSDPTSGLLSSSWFSSFLKDFMDSLDIAEAHFVAHSLGGPIALSMALSFPERMKKIILIDSAGFGQVSRAGIWLLFLIRGIKRVLGKEKSPRYHDAPMEDWLFINRLEEIKTPVLIVWGKKDPYLPVSHARLAQRLIPDCRLHIFKGCRHAPHRERAEEFNELAYRFLTERAPAQHMLLPEGQGQPQYVASPSVKQ